MYPFAGRTNVGKSTLLNLLVGEKVAAIANKVQTTRTQIRGIVNRENSQIVFIDTPGIHKPKTKLNENMVELSWDAIQNCDIILFLIEADSKEIGRGDSKILEKIKEANKKCILIINKVDLVKKEQLAEIINLYKNEYDFSAVIPISANKIKYREVVLNEIEKNLKPGPSYYDKEEYTDQTLRQLAEETIREKALVLLRDEVPHGIFVEVEKMKLKKTQNKEDIYNIEAVIYCLKNSHKGIIIGKNGEMLKRIGTLARVDMEKNFGTKVNLKTWVKVKEDWMNDEKFFGRKQLNFSNKKQRMGNDKRKKEVDIMIKDMAWNMFKSTGNVDTYLELKQIENIQKIQANLQKVDTNGSYKNERNHNSGK